MKGLIGFLVSVMIVFGVLSVYQSGGNIPTLDQVHCSIMSVYTSVPIWLVGCLAPVWIVWVFFGLVIGLNELDNGGRWVALSCIPVGIILIYSFIVLDNAKGGKDVGIRSYYATSSQHDTGSVW